MHTIQYIATRAENTDLAFRQVKDYLETQMGNGDTYNTWYDWFVTGGGRWAKNDSAQYDDNYQDEVASQDSPLFQEYLNIASKYRTDEFNRLVEEARKLNLTELLDTLSPAEFRGGMELYCIKKIYDMTMGMWDYQSYFFDMETDSTNMKHMRESIDNGAKDWYLVPVDFHF